MQFISSRRLILSAAVLAVAAAPAWCDDFLLSGASARTVGVAGAYVPSADNPQDAMAINPAGLALLGGRRLDVSVASMFARGHFSNAANTDAQLNSNGAVPFAAFGTPIGKSRFTLGLGLLPELMAMSRWQYRDAPGGAGGVSYGLMNHNSEIMAMRASAGLGVFLSQKVQVGVTFGGVYNSNTLQTAYVFQSHPALAGLKTGLDLHTTGYGWKTTVGVLVHPTRNFEFGVAWKSKVNIASKGTATGNAGVQFAAIGLGAARPDFRYDAQVDNILPQSLVGNIAWSVNPRTRIVAQGDWVNWKNAFATLPVTLTNGNNADINGLLKTNGIKDGIPLDWKDQVVGRVGVERSWLEAATLRFGYARASNPVPSSTLSPLTAAITRNNLSAGFGYRFAKWRVDAAYSVDPTATAQSGRSALKSGEYNNSTVKLNTQAVVLTASFRL
jgi:long-subunit fatty acid transport protein